MHHNKQDYHKENTSLVETLHDSLEEDNSDNFSLDSLECQKEERYGEERSLASEKHRKGGDSSSAEEKAVGILEKDSSKERTTEIRITAVPLYNGEVTVTHIHKLRGNDCKAKDTRTKADLKTTNSTKGRKHLVKGSFRKSYPPNGTDDKRAKCFLGRWLMQAHEYSLQREEKAQFKSNGTVCNLMKDLRLTDCQPRRMTRSDCGTAPSTSCKIDVPYSYTSLQYENRNNRKNFIRENKINCTFRRQPKNVSYLEKFQERKFANLPPRPSPEGSSRSTCGDTSTLYLNLSEEDTCESCRHRCWKAEDEDDESFYMREMQKDMLHDRTEISLSTFSEDTARGILQIPEQRRRRMMPAPSRIMDLRTVPTLGRLGPDPEVCKEKYEKLIKQKEYGNSVSRTNIALLRTRHLFNKKSNQEILQQEGQQKVAAEPPPFHQPPAVPPSETNRCSIRGRSKQDGQGKKEVQKPKRGSEVNRKQEVAGSTALLQELQRRHYEEMEKAEAIRKQLAYSK